MRPVLAILCPLFLSNSSQKQSSLILLRLFLKTCSMQPKVFGFITCPCLDRVFCPETFNLLIEVSDVPLQKKIERFSFRGQALSRSVGYKGW